MGQVINGVMEVKYDLKLLLCDSQDLHRNKAEPEYPHAERFCNAQWKTVFAYCRSW